MPVHIFVQNKEEGAAAAVNVTVRQLMKLCGGCIF